MDESWNHLQNLEAHIKEHNTHIDKITPIQAKHSRQSSGYEEFTKRSLENSHTSKMLAMAKELREKDLEIMYLKRDKASLEIFKDQCVNMQNQIKLLREKAVLCEREAQSKTFRLSSLENTTVPKAEKLEMELKDSQSNIEKLQKALVQTKKELEEKNNTLNSMKQNFSGQEAGIKSLEDEKRMLKGKLNELQGKFDEVFKQHEKNIEHLKNKDQLTLALEEDNERLRAQIENTMESLQKCQYELSLLPKLRQDIHQREQLVSAASKEIEREKNLRQKVLEEKDRIELQLSGIYEATEGTDPLDYIQELKTVINKSSKEKQIISDELFKLKQSKTLIEVENSELLQYTSTCIENLWKTLSESFFKSESLQIPDLDESVKPVLEPLYIELQQIKRKTSEKLKEQQETIQFMSERIAKYEKNLQIRKKMEEMEELIQKQEFLSEQLTIENTKIKKELEIVRDNLSESLSKAEELENELQESFKANENLLVSFKQAKKELEDKTKDFFALKQSYLKQETVIESLEEEKKILEDEKNSLCEEKDELEETKKILENEKKAMLKKFSEVQDEFEIFLTQHEKNLSSSKQKEEIIADLRDEIERINEENERIVEENRVVMEDNHRLSNDNERLGKELENTIEALQKCQVEINVIPKIKHDTVQKSQQLNLINSDLEKEKKLKSEIENKKNRLESLFENLKDLCEDSDPADFILNQKSEISKLAKEKVNLSTEISELNIKNSQFIKDLQSNIEQISSVLSKNFLSGELKFELTENFQLHFSSLLSCINTLQSAFKEKISDYEDNIEYLSAQIANYEQSLPKRVETTDDLIEKQEFLFSQLNSENSKLKKDLKFASSQLEESDSRIADLERIVEDLQNKAKKLKFKNSNARSELEEKSKILSAFNKTQQQYEDLLDTIRQEKDELENEKLMLEEEKNCLEAEKTMLIDEKKDLNTKLLNLQHEFQRFFENQDSNITSIKDKQVLITALIEDNHKLKKHVEHTLEILTKYRV